MNQKSPFLVYQDFLDSKTCDRIADTVYVQPLKTDDDQLTASGRHHSASELEIFEKFKPLTKELEKHYGFKYRGTEHLIFQQFPISNGKLSESAHCENAVFKRKKWIRTKDRDLTGLLWLKDYQDSPQDFDKKRHVLGGKLEFPLYQFGFQPQKGTLVIYPACERFISVTSAIMVGELQCVRFHICGEGIWLYDPENFPGDFRTWFSHVV